MEEPLTHEHGFKYYDFKPEEFVRCGNIKDFLKLKGTTRLWKKENIEVKRGMKYLVQNPVTHVYWYRETHKHTDVRQLNMYIRDENVYILKEDKDNE